LPPAAIIPRRWRSSRICQGLVPVTGSPHNCLARARRSLVPWGFLKSIGAHAEVLSLYQRTYTLLGDGGSDMATGRLGGVPHHLRRVTLRGDGGGMTDGQLLDSFLTRRDEAAFEALVRRHGPMVLAVCRRVLHSAHDAEDAFQATFLVLVRKARSI